jgi:signal peptidase I
VGLPGQTLQIKDRIVYLDGQPNKEPDNVQYNYHVHLRDGLRDLPEAVAHDLRLSSDDLRDLHQTGIMPLTAATRDTLLTMTNLVESIDIDTSSVVGEVYPVSGCYGWTRDNYGPVWIPKKGESVELTLDNLPIYERPIRVYEGNELAVRDGKIYINGKQADSYTFKLDYYWMMGDNRHNSADSRYWGFVPEDHIVGKPLFIWWSSDPDHNGFSGIRWNRLFKWVDNIK